MSECINCMEVLKKHPILAGMSTFSCRVQTDRFLSYLPARKSAIRIWSSAKLKFFGVFSFSLLDCGDSRDLHTILSVSGHLAQLFKSSKCWRRMWRIFPFFLHWIIVVQKSGKTRLSFDTNNLINLRNESSNYRNLLQNGNPTGEDAPRQTWYMHIYIYVSIYSISFVTFLQTARIFTNHPVSGKCNIRHYVCQETPIKGLVCTRFFKKTLTNIFIGNN